MKPRIGVIGGGIYGTTMLKVYSAAHRMGQIELVSLADIKEEVLQEQEKRFHLKGYLDYKEMIQKENLDAVAIVTPDYLHREITNEVANHGLHMLVQKPLDVTTRGAKEMVKEARKNNVMLFVDFHKRFDPGHIQLRADIQRGKLGKIQYGYVWMEDSIIVPSVWFKNWAQYSSPVWFLGIHFFDLLYWMLKSKPKKIYATGMKDKLIGMGIDTYDSIQTKIEFENEVNFSVDCSWILPKSFPSVVNQGIRVAGSNGLWEVDSQDRGIFFAIEDSPGSSIPNYYGMLENENPMYGMVPQGYIAESMLYFLQMINKLKSGMSLKELEGCYPSGDEAVVSTLICETIHQSLEKKKMIELN